MPQRATTVTDGRVARPSFVPTLSEVGAPAWFALRVRSRSDFAVKERVEGLGIECFLPTYVQVSRWSDRSKSIERPLFPGYVFCAARPDDVTRLTYMAGVAYVVTSGGSQPAQIPDEEIEQLRRVLASRSPIEPCAYVAGQAVEIETGPLAGVKGVVTRTCGALRVTVAIELLKRAVRVEVDAASLRGQ